MFQRFALVLSAAAVAATVACSQSDPGITTAVKTKIAADDTVKASEINVDTGKSVVTLNGTVASTAEKDRAVAIARDTKGVTDVIDDIAIGQPVATTGSGMPATSGDDNVVEKAGEAVTDAAITSEVKAKFLAEPGVAGLKINVDTTDGVVTLKGNVKSRDEADKAIAIAHRSAGVKSVVNNLIVP